MGTGLFDTGNLAVRDAWIAEQIRTLPDGGIILDAGSGTQPYRSLCSRLIYKAHDFGAYDGVGDGQGQQTSGWRYGALDYVSDLWEIPSPDASFDAILCTEVLEHIPYPNEAIKEFARLLKPGGVLLVTVPFASTVHMSPYFYYSGFGEEYFRRICGQNGLTVELIVPNGNKIMLAMQILMGLEEAIKSRLGRLFFRLAAVPIAAFLRVMSRRMNTDMLREGFIGLHVRAVRN